MQPKAQSCPVLSSLLRNQAAIVKTHTCLIGKHSCEVDMFNSYGQRATIAATAVGFQFYKKEAAKS